MKLGFSQSQWLVCRRPPIAKSKGLTDMLIRFPYPDMSLMEIPERNLSGVYALAEKPGAPDPGQVIQQALDRPIGTPPLRELAHGKRKVLIVCDDVSRPTPAWQIIPSVLRELEQAGIERQSIEFMMALGTHRPMTNEEMRQKVGADVFAQYRVNNHDWQNPGALHFVGRTDQGVEVWINRKVAAADLVIGIGRIMPIDICGFTGGGKILIPGCCGEITNSEMHWNRADLDSGQIVGQRDNAVRASIDSMARQAGLAFIVNVIMNAESRIIDCVAGDLTEAHRVGCHRAHAVHEVRIPRKADIVVADGAPFDIEFWQVNKAVDTAGLVVRKGGVVICVSPCYEGLSRTHEAELLKYGYRPKAEIKRLVESGELHPKVVGVHMIQVSEVALEKARLILVTQGISEADIKRVGLHYAATPQQALEMAFQMTGSEAQVAVLRGAAQMLPIVGEDESK
jgi:lactate racemase